MKFCLWSNQMQSKYYGWFDLHEMQFEETLSFYSRLQKEASLQ